MLCESDARGQLGIEGVSVGWQRIVVDVRLGSRAPEAEVRRVVETADRLSPLLANLSSGIERVHHLRFVALGNPQGLPNPPARLRGEQSSPTPHARGPEEV